MKKVTLKLDVRAAAAVRQVLFEAQRGYGLEHTPERIVDIRSVIQDLDDAIDVVVKESGQNALAVFELPKEMPAWDPKEGEFYLMVESVEKPGNLGALLRSADAAGANGVVLCDERIDGFHPQVIRNSVGTTFTVPLFVMTSAQAWDKIQHNKVRLYTTFMESSVSVWQSDLTGCVAMLVGTEHQGVSEFWRDKGENINIPMFGSVDSLNVSVAASLLLYEAKRQRERLGL